MATTCAFSCAGNASAATTGNGAVARVVDAFSKVETFTTTSLGRVSGVPAPSGAVARVVDALPSC